MLAYLYCAAYTRMTMNESSPPCEQRRITFKYIHCPYQIIPFLSETGFTDISDRSHFKFKFKTQILLEKSIFYIKYR